jgi:hypothetical protein
MKIGGFFHKSLFVPVLLAAGASLGLWMTTPGVQAAPKPQEIEIVIHDGEAKVVRGFTLHGFPTKITVRNEDSVMHGFASSIFEEKPEVKMSGGSLAEGESHVYRVSPGKTMVLEFTPPKKLAAASTTYAFWCDLHRTLKGEMEVVGVEPGEF